LEARKPEKRREGESEKKERTPDSKENVKERGSRYEDRGKTEERRPQPSAFYLNTLPSSHYFVDMGGI
jgi:hypothetical protein